ncbi:MAG: hypothetical protein H8E32_10055 [Nitrospinae bacterium]|nr:hypothetical protein [Nitrospinota bacterium]
MPELEVAYQKFLKRVYEETENPEWNIENHPTHKILSRYPDGFRNWVNYLESMLLIKKGGYPFSKNDLDIMDWKALAYLEKLQS